MILPKISIAKPVFAWMLMSAMILFGAISFMRLGVSLLPEVEMPSISVSVNLPGAAPEVIESSVLQVLEGQLSGLPSLKTITSTGRFGQGSLTLDFDLDRNIDLAFQDVQTKIAQIQRILPENAEAASVSKINPEDQPILWLGVRSKTLQGREFMEFARDRLQDAYSTVSGVAEVFIGGYSAPALRITADPRKLQQYSLSVDDISQTVLREAQDKPAGKIQNITSEWSVQTLGQIHNAKELGELFILNRGGSPNYRTLRLNQVARVEAGQEELKRISFLDGVPSLGLGIRKQRGTNSVAVAEAVKKRTLEIMPSVGKDVEIFPVFDTTQFIKDAVHELEWTLILSAILTALVCWFFLNSLSSTFNVLLSIPTSIVGSFLIMYFGGFTLNTFTLLSLSLAIGIVVDDAIMVLENMIRHREMGKPAKVAALDGAVEIYSAALSSTLAIAAIFVPILFVKGIIGKYLFSFGVTLTGAVLLSFVEAVTLTPMRASQMNFAVKKTHSRKFLDWIVTGYTKILAYSLGHPKKILVGGLIFFISSLFIFKILKKEDVPSEDQSRIMVRFRTPIGSSILLTQEKALQLEKIVRANPEVEHVFGYAGGFGGSDGNAGMMFVTLKPKGERKKGHLELIEDFQKALAPYKELRIQVQDMTNRLIPSGRGFAFEFAIKGGTWEELDQISKSWEEKMNTSGIFRDVTYDLKMGLPELTILPDRQAAALRNVSVQSLSQTIQTALNEQAIATYSNQGRTENILLKLENPYANDIHAFSSALQIRNNFGELVPLLSVAKIQERKSIQVINRENRERTVGFTANFAPGKEVRDGLSWLKEQGASLPGGYRTELMGTLKGGNETMSELWFTLLLGILVSYMILGSQFNSFLQPITVLLSMPFALSGAWIALWVSGKSVNFYSFIGFILLMGIVKKNSILIVEFCNQLREQHPDEDLNSLVLKGSSLRLRPILMTSFATIAGAVPAALSIGPGSESRTPMAIALMGGVLFSTMLSLILVPCFYSWSEKIKQVWFSRTGQK